MKFEVEGRFGRGGGGGDLAERLKKSADEVAHGEEVDNAGHEIFDFLDKN